MVQYGRDAVKVKWRTCIVWMWRDNYGCERHFEKGESELHKCYRPSISTCSQCSSTFSSFLKSSSLLLEPFKGEFSLYPLFSKASGTNCLHHFTLLYPAPYHKYVSHPKHFLWNIPFVSILHSFFLWKKCYYKILFKKSGRSYLYLYIHLHLPNN